MLDCKKDIYFNSNLLNSLQLLESIQMRIDGLNSVLEPDKK